MAKAILAQPAMLDDMKRIADGLHKKWVTKLAASAASGGAGLDAADAVLCRAGMVVGGR